MRIGSIAWAASAGSSPSKATSISSGASGPPRNGFERSVVEFRLNV
ncbi:hypothetical protein [Kribbella kalugense]|nr:hypothetical protein [Kribbella kalugense]